MIVDAFTFFNELDLLELRLIELSPHVDRFVLAEADKTHAGNPKPMYFSDNLGRYKEWLPKIVLVEVKLPPLPASGDRWALENAHRNAISAGLEGLEGGDTVLIGDVDELPMLAGWDGREGVFRCQETYYKMNLWAGPVQNGWNGTCAIKAWRFSSPFGAIRPQDVRNFRDLMQPTWSGGWHFSWTGDAGIKLASFAHTEPVIAERVAARVHPATGQRLMPFDINGVWYPQAIRDNRGRFPYLFEVVSG